MTALIRFLLAVGLGLLAAGTAAGAWKAYNTGCVFYLFSMASTLAAGLLESKS